MWLGWAHEPEATKVFYTSWDYLMQDENHSKALTGSRTRPGADVRRVIHLTDPSV